MSAFIDTVKTGVATAVDTINDVSEANEDVDDVSIFATFVKKIDEVTRGVI